MQAELAGKDDDFSDFDFFSALGLGSDGSEGGIGGGAAFAAKRTSSNELSGKQRLSFLTQAGEEELRGHVAGGGSGVSTGGATAAGHFASATAHQPALPLDERDDEEDGNA